MELIMTKDHWALNSLRPMNDEEFFLWQALIESRVGMTVGESRRSFLCTNLGVRMRELGIHDYESYYELLVQGKPAVVEPEWAILTDRLTVQETSFFRHQPSFDCLSRHLNECLMRPTTRELQVWSVGCSTGEEPYSVAMLLQVLIESSGRSRDLFWGVMASDISIPALIKGRKGQYSERRIQQIPEMWRQKFLDPVQSGTCQFKSFLRDKVCFAQLNIMEIEDAPYFDMDVIFCQNVLIYFKKFRKRDIVAHLVDKLKPGGLLILGVNELVDWQHPELVRVPDPGVLAFSRKII